MRRKKNAATQTQTNDSRSAWVNHSTEDFTCPVTQFLFFDPVIACNTAVTCGHLFEKRECVGKLQKCPCCQDDITLFSPALHTKNTLDEILCAHPELWQGVYFNFDHFTLDSAVFIRSFVGSKSVEARATATAESDWHGA